MSDRYPGRTWGSRPPLRSSRATPLSVIAFLAGTSLVGTTNLQAQERESIFDRIVHLESRVHTEIPVTPRLEERLGIEGRLIDVGEANLWVEEEGSGTPMVLINGGPGGTHHQFHPWFSQVAEFARVIYYDQRGCGLSDYEPGPDGYSVHQAAEDLEALRKALGLDTWVLVGFSYGGFLAQYYTTVFPESVAGLVLVGASPGIRADVGRSRQRDFMAPEELEMKQRILAELRDVAPDRGWSPAEILALVVYNNFLNGDWKRQHYYKPSRERMAQIALYEWVQDENFNGIVGQSMSGIDFTGVFDANPIPTLIMEGEWDLTWGEEKKEAFAQNHPNGEMVVFQEAGHSIYSEDSDGFFGALRGFMESLTPPEPQDLASFQASLESVREAWARSAATHLNTMDWGWSASQAMAEAYDASWLDEIDNPSEYLRLGFALYDMEQYEEALTVFGRLHAWGREEGEVPTAALGCIWQGHMLDLLGRRGEALEIYQRVADMGLTNRWSHDQYGLRYLLSPWAAERLETPFERIENRGE